MASFQEEWLNVEDSIRQRGIFLFSNDLLSDVGLVVQAESESDLKAKKTKMTIPAHKVVLSMCSPVFFAMFCGELAETSDSIDLPDCEYEGVLEMLRYMYSGEAKLNENNVMQVLYVAKKYIVKSLADECIQFLQRNLNPENVFCLLSHAEQYDERVLVDQCWEVIDRETEEAMKSEGFLTIDKPLLEEIVKRETLTISEVDVFKAVDLWAIKECERQELIPDGSIKRRILGEAIVEQIRFPVMEEQDFVNIVLHSKILTQLEVGKLMKHFNPVSTSPTSFHGDKRVGALQSCFRFGGIDRCCKVDNKECLHLYLERADIMLHGIRLFGSENSEYEVTLTVEDIIKGEIASKSGKFSSTLLHRKASCYYGYDVMFDPVHLRRQTYYIIKVKIKGPPRTYCGKQRNTEVIVCDVTFFFYNIYKKTCEQFVEFLFKLP